MAADSVARPAASPAQRAPAGPAGPPAAEITQQSALSLLRSRGRARGVVALLGPAFVAAVAYKDPGNFATNL